MIVVKLMGGLGNQMFQFAAGRALSLKNNCRLYLDDTFLNADPKGIYTKRCFELGQLKVEAKLADKEFLRIFKKRGFFSGMFKRNLQRLNEKPPRDVSFHAVKAPVYLDGFWQSEFYFENHRELLQKELSPNYDLEKEAGQYFSMIKQCTSVSVHVRRGDYVDHKGASDFHGALGMEYYRSAVNLISQKDPECRFFIFTDDIDWCRKEFTFGPDFVFVETGSTYSSCDLFLMQLCDHNILANSSYSWWGAWLNQKPGKIVIAPSKWFAESAHPNDIYAHNWIKL